MSYSNYNITLDVRKTVASVQLNAKRGDTGRKIYITLSDHGIPCKIADGCYAVFAGTKPDGTLLYNKTTVEDNTIIYAMTQQTTAVAGLVACEVKLFDSMSNLLTSPKLTILVDDVVVPDEEIASKDEVSALAELILNGGGSGGSVTDEQIASAVEDYFAENPVECADAVKTVNGQTPDENGNVEITIPGGASIHACTYTGTISNYGYIACSAEKSCFPNGDPKVGDLFVTTTGHLCRVLVVAPGTDLEGKPSVLIQYAHMRDLNGQPGNDYVLTEADKQEIAEQAAQMVEIPQEAGITHAEKNLILSLFRNAAYTSDAMGNTLAQLEELWSGSDEPIIPDVPEPGVTLTSISAVYSGGDVAAGTAVTALTGIVVTAHYSNGTSTTVTAYTLSGTIAEGSNTITVKFGGKTTTFTVVGVAVETEVSNETKWTDGVAYDYASVENEYVNDSDGTTVTYNGWCRTPHLYCAGASKIRIQIAVATNIINQSSINDTYNAFYDGNKNFIQNFSFRGLDGLTEGAYFDVDVPANAAYFMVSHKHHVICGNDQRRPYIDMIPCA